MPRPRRDEVLPPDEVCFAHCYNRCVQGTYLFGVEPTTGKDYSYRKDWIAQRIEQLASVFLIDVLAFAVMENHLHLVVRTCPDEVAKLSDRDVAIRWLSLHPGYQVDEFVCVDPTEAQIREFLADSEEILRVRGALSSPSVFMKDLTEPIAKRANAEDGRLGHFWEDRFKAKRLLDSLAILVCVAYVDLNLLRAGIARTLEGSNYTSIQARIHGDRNQMAPSYAFSKIVISDQEVARRIQEVPDAQLRKRLEIAKKQAERPSILKDAWLAKLTIDPKQSVNPNDSHLSRSGLRATDKGFLPVNLEQYIKILAESLRFKPGKAIAFEPSRELLEVSRSVGVNPENICWLISDFKKIFRRGHRVGSPEMMRRESARFGRKRTANTNISRLFYSIQPVGFDELKKRYIHQRHKTPL